MIVQEKRMFETTTYLEAVDAAALGSGVGPVVDLGKIRFYTLYYMKDLRCIVKRSNDER